MPDKEIITKTDILFYKSEIYPILPEIVLDFHTHIWREDVWKEIPWEAGVKGGKYMVIEKENPVEKLMADGEMMFPGLIYNAVCFSLPMPSINMELANRYVGGACKNRTNLFPLMLIGKDKIPQDKIIISIFEGGFWGYKVMTPWYGDDYGMISIKDMIGPREMEIADKYGLVVLFHVPRAERLADPEVQEDLREYATRYHNAKIVLAHCGRSYLPEQILKAIRFLKEVENIYLDTAMVMEPQVLQIIFENIDYRRVLFGTDLPIARMKGRRVYVMNHWVDLVLPGYPESAYRVSAYNIDATFMTWEIVLAIKRACQAAGLSSSQLKEIFYDNGMRVLEGVKIKNQGKGTS